ncbi:ATP-dependent DNA helicase RecG [Nakamurella silvestris]|nr:ATP-dependent DNA helicase RecG [Nakamurella silvestris]
METKLSEAVGARTANPLAKGLGLVTVGDLLRHYPRKYDQRGRLTNLSELEIGDRVTVMAKVVDSSHAYTQKGGKGGRGPALHRLTLTISDGRSRLKATFFNQIYLLRLLTVGTEALFSGRINTFNGALQLSGPTALPLGVDPEGKAEQIEEFAGLIPIYPLSEGLSLQTVQKTVKHVLEVIEDIPDPIPAQTRLARGLVGLDTALRDIHRPRSEADKARAETRLAYDEALAMQLVFAQRREESKQFPAEPCPPIPDGLLAIFDENLPFALTAGQREVGEAISADLSTLHPMNRLLQGEVGSGKTVVALRAMLQVIDGGRQAVLLAPTEVLAAQHARSLANILGPLARGGELGSLREATRVTLLTGSLGAAARKQALLDIASGQAGIVVGTHALLGKDVFFAELGLVVVDEQHRFGVEQRDALRKKHPKGNPPHVLVMTATPIPRTVAMTVYGDMETSTLRELPAGRSPIKTNVVPMGRQTWVERVWEVVREEVAKGRQTYVVCPRIGGDGPEVDEADPDGDPADLAELVGDKKRRPPLAVVDVAEHLRSGPLAGLRLAELTGRMLPAEKDAVMGAFGAGEVDVLVATTVIEVGVDVPNSTVMVVMDAHRFGLSQIHQLRGRIGRGSEAGICFLVHDASPTGAAGRRLDVAASTNDGFELARADLEFRREGDILGTTQAGRSTSLRKLSMIAHEDIIGWAREDAAQAVDTDPTLQRYPMLAALVRAMFDEEDRSFLEKG